MLFCYFIAELDYCKVMMLYYVNVLFNNVILCQCVI